MNTSGLYIHIPFCKTKCHYCDFYSVVAPDQKEVFLEALCVEIASESAFLQRGESFWDLRKPLAHPGSSLSHSERPLLRTIYFGGGTPSQLNESEFRSIFEAIEAHYDLSKCEEITLEANPDDLSTEYIQALRRLPFNRISIGVQSFLDNELLAINRRHSSDAAIKAVQKCFDLGFENISIDLMYGLPGQTLESFGFSLDVALSLPVTHISSYALSWEEGSVLYQKRLDGVLTEASDELLESCFFTMKERLEGAGFQHYELSNFAREGCISKHNSSYWDGTSYLGVGPSAHSYNGVERRFNSPSLHRYTNGIRSGHSDREVEALSKQDGYNDFVVTRMRTINGMDMQELENRFGSERHQYCVQNASKWLKTNVLALAENRLKLTSKGLFISDAVMSDLLWVH